MLLYRIRFQTQRLRSHPKGQKLKRAKPNLKARRKAKREVKPAGKGILPLAFYVDESGNSGSNLFDSSQPIFVTTANGIHGEDGIAVEKKRLIDACGISCDENGQIKSATLLANRRFRKELYTSIRRVISKSGMDIAYSIIEKRCFATFLLLRYLLDERYTPGLDVSIEDDGDSYYEATQVLFDLVPDDLLKEGVRSIIACDEVAFWNVVASVNEILKKTTKDIGLLEYSQGLTEEIIRKKAFADEDVPYSSTKKIVSPNHAGFLDIRNSLAARSLEIEFPIKIVHDRQDVYAETFKKCNEFISTFRNNYRHTGSITSVPLITGPISDIPIEFKEAKNNVRLQFADWFTGSLRFSVEQVLRSPGNDPWSNEDDRKFISFFLWFIRAKTIPLIYDFDMGCKCSTLIRRDLLMEIIRITPNELDNFE